MVQKSIAHFISYLFHPIFLPTYAIAFLLWTNPYYFSSINSPEGASLLMIMILNSIVFPLIVLTVMSRSDLIADLQLTERRQRALPFLVMIFFMFWTYFVVQYRLQFPPFIPAVVWGGFLSLMMAYFINILWFKISIHTLGMGNLIAVILFAGFFSLYSLGWILMAVILLAGIVGTARLILRAHRPIEVYMGYLVGFLTQTFAFIY